MVPGQFSAQDEFRFIPAHITLITHVVISTKDKAKHALAFIYINEKGTKLPLNGEFTKKIALFTRPHVD